MWSIHSNILCPVLSDEDNQLGFPEKIPCEADSKETNGTRFSKHRTWPQAHDEGAEGTMDHPLCAYRSYAAQSENWKRVSGLLLSAGLLGCNVFVGVLLP